MPKPPISGAVIIGGDARVSNVTVRGVTARGGEVGVWVGGRTTHNVGVSDVDWAPRSGVPAPTHVESLPGRNDPCSCGSGVKYKKCCGR